MPVCTFLFAKVYAVREISVYAAVLFPTRQWFNEPEPSKIAARMDSV